MNNLYELLDEKGREVFSVGPEKSVYEAVESMANHRIGALVVLKSDKLVGILSERDYARKVILNGRSSKTTTVGEIMTEDVVHVNPEISIEGCMGLMTEHRVRHLPILENGKLIGVVSIGDLVKAVIAEQQQTIEHLQQYITG